MKKVLAGLVLLSSLSFAVEYFAKVEPITTYNIKSSVSGKVFYVNKHLESKRVKNEVIIQIDDKINKIDLKQTQLKLNNLKEILKLEKSTLESFKKVSSKSRFDKDNQKIKILNINSSISDIKIKIATLKDVISKKLLIENDNYIYNIAVEIGDYINPGTLLYTAMDLSKGKVSVYLPINKAKKILTKTIYMDGIKTNLKISKLYNVADTKHISSFKCEIIIPKPKLFSALVKIEFK
jgi:hypothetical protein